MSKEVFPEFKPNFDNYNKLLVVDGNPVNDLQLALVQRGTQFDDFLQPNGLVDEDNSLLSDDDCFSSVVPKHIQTYGEITTYLNHIKDGK